MKLENVIYCGDNLIWLKKFPDNCIDLMKKKKKLKKRSHLKGNIIFLDLITEK